MEALFIIVLFLYQLHHNNQGSLSNKLIFDPHPRLPILETLCEEVGFGGWQKSACSVSTQVISDARSGLGNTAAESAPFWALRNIFNKGVSPYSLWGSYDRNRTDILYVPDHLECELYEEREWVWVFSPLYLQCVSTVPGTEYLVNIYRMNQWKIKKSYLSKMSESEGGRHYHIESLPQLWSGAKKKNI